MKKPKTTFLLSEICLAILLLLCVRQIFADEKPQKRVAVIVEKSGDEKWDSFFNGVKQAARMQNIHLIICNTDEIEDAHEESALIYEQLDNQVDAFIIQAAPGNDTETVLKELRTQKPVILVANDILGNVGKSGQSKRSGLPVIMPDNYSMGYALGEDMVNRNVIEGRSVGIVGGLEGTEYAADCRQGLLDALAAAGCEIAFDIGVAYDVSITEALRQQRAVDYLFVLDTNALEQAAAMYAGKEGTGTKLYGIGNSMKCVYYLDDSVIDGLILVDGYSMGYKSILELSNVLNKRLYAASDYVIEYRLIHKEDIFREDVQQFLYTYD